VFPASGAVIASALLALPSAASAATPGSVWSIVNSPNVTTGQFSSNVLKSVAAGSSTNVWAAGFSNTTLADPRTDAPLIEHWDGTAWTVSPTAAANAELTSISTDSANDAWAVGNVVSNRTVLSEHWNGTAWTQVSVPLPAGAISARLEGVTALSATNAWAVGTYSDNELNLPLIEHWDGTRWSVTANVPRQVSESNDLHGITAISPTDIWAVGQFDQGGTSPKSQLLMHFDGVSWSLSHPAQIAPGESNAFPVAVTANSSTDVWAVGGTGVTNADGVTSQQPFSMHWDGTQWSEVATETPAQISSGFSFFSVAAMSQNDVWAVGGNAGNGIIEHWNGSRWTTAGTPALGVASLLGGVAKSGASTLWAVGEHSPTTGLVEKSLTMRTTKG
jgi:hypothetical protein